MKLFLSTTLHSNPKNCSTCTCRPPQTSGCDQSFIQWLRRNAPSSTFIWSPKVWLEVRNSCFQPEIPAPTKSCWLSQNTVKGADSLLKMIPLSCFTVQKKVTFSPGQHFPHDWWQVDGPLAVMPAAHWLAPSGEAIAARCHCSNTLWLERHRTIAGPLNPWRCCRQQIKIVPAVPESKNNVQCVHMSDTLFPVALFWLYSLHFECSSAVKLHSTSLHPFSAACWLILSLHQIFFTATLRPRISIK